jgi:thymidylate synthase (FAD)
MKIIKASFELLAFTPNMTQLIEQAGRVCYKSEDRICEGSDTKFIEHLKGLHHESVLEHGSITVKFICDRGVSHELVRHRIASFSQESTRYVNYSKGKFGSEITVIEPSFYIDKEVEYALWKTSCEQAETHYMALINAGSSAQQARTVLPNSLKTEIVVTANPREWRHILTMRTANAAHPQMRELMLPLLAEFKTHWPSLYSDIGESHE